MAEVGELDGPDSRTDEITNGSELRLADAGDLEQVFDHFEPPILIPERNDPLGQNRAHPGERLELPGRCGVHVDERTIARSTGLRWLFCPGARHDDLIPSRHRRRQIDLVDPGSWPQPTGGLDGVDHDRARYDIDHPR